MVPLSEAFGKLDRENRDLWHSLVDHLADVAATFEALLSCTAIRRALECAAGRPVTDVEAARLVALAFLHDIGKTNTSFQGWRYSDKERPKDWLTAGHSIEAATLLKLSLVSKEAAEICAGLPLDEIFEWGSEVTISSLFWASIAHHGRPVIGEAAWTNTAKHWLPRDGYDPAAQMKKIGDAVRTFIPQAFLSDGPPLPDSPEFAHYFAGLVQLADWLGSSIAFFPYSQPGEDRLATSRERARNAVQKVGLDTESFRHSLIDSAPSFEAVFDDNSPYPMQAAMADDSLGPVVVLEAETGSGKTEAALWRFLYLYQQGKVDSLYFALPTRVAASQAYKRVREAVAKIWPNGGPLVLRALPGYVAADDTTFQSLPEFKVLWSDDPSDAEASRRWAAEGSKRFLAAPIAIGTIDQALLGTLQVKHAHLRHALVARSLLVIDEVHASDAYMGALTERLVSTQTRLGGHSLLLSATLGAAARARYLSRRRMPSVPALEQARHTHYPAISDFNGLRETSGMQRSKTVRWRLVDAMKDPKQVAALAIAAAAKGARVLVIRNTVAAAKATLEALEEATPDSGWLFSVGGVATLHHSRFSREDRPLLDDQVEAQLGKERPSGPLIVVGTQTLEQSLDLDADYLITDLCPMDVLLQRIGRLHRHRKNDLNRPEAFREAQVCVLTPVNGELTPYLTDPREGFGFWKDRGSVYPDVRILEATRKLVVDKPLVNIPADNRELVELATHPEALLKVAGYGPSWAAHGQQVDGAAAAMRTSANIGGLQTDECFSDLEDWGIAKYATRLGAADRLVCFDPPRSGPFGTLVAELPIRHHLLPSDLPDDAKPEKIVVDSECGFLFFQLGLAWYRYSRLGLERLEQDPFLE